MAGEPPDPGVESRFEALVTSYQKFLHETVLKLCPRDLGLQVDEIEQEVRIRLWRAIQSETDIRHGASYIHRVVLTATIDAIRRVRARREDPFDPLTDDANHDVLGRPAAPASPERIVERRQLFDRVAAALARISPDRRRAAGLYLEGLTLQEIAALLNWSESRTRNLMYRGLNDLRKLLRADGIDYENQ
jgi:RNA polymerase sigma factor (sigma-70 family)